MTTAIADARDAYAADTPDDADGDDNDGDNGDDTDLPDVDDHDADAQLAKRKAAADQTLLKAIADADLQLAIDIDAAGDDSQALGGQTQTS